MSTRRRRIGPLLAAAPVLAVLLAGCADPGGGSPLAPGSVPADGVRRRVRRPRSGRPVRWAGRRSGPGARP
ncbi:hypothetical protein [Kitasatospora sp. NA04385]|uniref:hypothetical protein n=1 Tax=Kitasatospora sp. NA04385 TaxID=2742135 RepID=UPI0020CAB438|nr:hypothetical protein [Kitasatospora sp. NA04385]